MKQGFILIFALIVFSSNAQNLIQNSGFSQLALNWDGGGCTTEAIFTEDAYGGPSTTNIVAEIDHFTCLQQDVCILPGTSYKISWVANRRTTGTCTIAWPGITVEVTGLTTGTIYSTANYRYDRPVDFGVWIYTVDSLEFAIPAGVVDKKVILKITPYENPIEPCGVLLDDIVMVPIPPFTVDGPMLACINSGTSWSTLNVPATGVNYTWSFPGASPSSSTLSNPTNIQWSTQGPRTVSTILSNGTCNVATITKAIDINCTLPVSLVSFNGANKGTNIDLQWTTASEINNDYFEVYRSKDGVSWELIGKVNATGASSATYSLTDAKPNAGKNYYQLKMVDKSGAYKNSNIVKITIGNIKNLDVSIYPSVVNNVLNYVVETAKKEKLRVMISDISGKRITNLTETFTTGNTQKSINVSNLATGMYLLTVTDETNSFKKSITFKKN